MVQLMEARRLETPGEIVEGQDALSGIYAEGANLLLGPLVGRFPRVAKVWVDSAYQGLRV